MTRLSVLIEINTQVEIIHTCSFCGIELKAVLKKSEVDYKDGNKIFTINVIPCNNCSLSTGEDK